MAGAVSGGLIDDMPISRRVYHSAVTTRDIDNSASGDELLPVACLTHPVCCHALSAVSGVQGTRTFKPACQLVFLYAVFKLLKSVFITRFSDVMSDDN